jgi:hypothetical protein
MITSDQVELILGLTVVATPAARRSVLNWRARRHAADAAEDASFTAFFARMRVAAQEQESDPRISAIVARYAHAVGRERARVGVHRPAVVRARLQAAISA